MRTLRLGRTFDVVFVHDAVAYMTTEDDLRDCIGTALAHTRPGGVALFVPDCTRETFRPAPSHGGHDGRRRARRSATSSGRSTPIRATRATRSTTRSLVREPGRAAAGRPDHHVEGLFPEHTWLYLLERAGFEPSVDRAAPR